MLRNHRIIPEEHNSNFYLIEVIKRIDSMYKFSFRTEEKLCLDVEAEDSYKIFCDKFPEADGYKVRLIRRKYEYIK